MCKTCASTPSTPYLQGTTCYSNCPERYFAGANNVCQPCAATCLTCSGSLASNCLTCDVLSTHKYKSGTSCLTACTSNQYLLGNTCYYCSLSCLTCNSSSAFDCTSCRVSEILIRESSTNNQCGTSCSNGNGYVLISTDCYKCPSNCQTCSSSSFCTQCYPGFFASGGACSTCSSNCGTCTGTATHCLTCNNSYYINYATHQCKATCDTATEIAFNHANQTNECKTTSVPHCLVLVNSARSQATSSTIQAE